MSNNFHARIVCPPAGGLRTARCAHRFVCDPPTRSLPLPVGYTLVVRW